MRRTGDLDFSSSSSASVQTSECAKHGGFTNYMTNTIDKNAKKVWFITGAGRGMGVEFARPALAAGNAVVATGRNTGAVSRALVSAGGRLVVKQDVTRPADAEAAVQAAIGRFGRIDVL